FLAEALVELEDPATTPGRTDAVLAALAERAGTGDAHASRVVLQYLLPCLVRVAYLRVGPPYASVAEALDALVSVAWETVRAGVEWRGRRPKIALLRAIEERALRGPRRAALRRHRCEVAGHLDDAATRA